MDDWLPIFPLPDLVLFPGATAAVHIFEPRYQEMVRELERSPPESRRIGFVLSIAESELAGEEELRRLVAGFENQCDEGPEGRIRLLLPGTIARVTSIRHLADGRSNLELTGESRFRFEQLAVGGPYRRARAELLDDSPFLGSPEEYVMLGSDLANLAATTGAEPLEQRALEAAASESDFERRVNRIAATLAIPPLRKQHLLSLDLTNRARGVGEILAARRRFLEVLRPFRGFAEQAEWN